MPIRPRAAQRLARGADIGNASRDRPNVSWILSNILWPHLLFPPMCQHLSVKMVWSHSIYHSYIFAKSYIHLAFRLFFMNSLHPDYLNYKLWWIYNERWISYETRRDCSVGKVLLSVSTCGWDLGLGHANTGNISQSRITDPSIGL